MNSLKDLFYTICKLWIGGGIISPYIQGNATDTFYINPKMFVLAFIFYVFGFAAEGVADRMGNEY